VDLLAALRAAPGEFVSGRRLAEEAGLSRAAIWKGIEELRARGYVIEALPHRGYRLISAPDRPYPEEIWDGLTTVRFGRRAIYLPSVGSTNDEAKRLAAAGWPEGTLVVAEEQTAGKGRLGRGWLSPPGGLWFSLILRPELSLAELGPLTILAAVALRRAILAETGFGPLVKWPNDLVANGKKLAGILAEAGGELGRVEAVILGIGLNVNQDEGDFPPPLRPHATSLRLLLGRPVARVPLLRTFLAHFEELYLGEREGRRDYLVEAAAHSATLGRRVRVVTGGAAVEGTALRLDPDGALVLRTGEGTVRILTGEVEEVRAEE
ncbi:MAG: biotin--[acetyl-CoA-carboxylase] ligase, partial [Firmicutes bacterium]|nr:biotin--[acetyl-CoA-carboxylase] ligase [Bacillota bacterium]